MVVAGSVGPRPILTHAQRVCRLYKKSYRCTEDWAVSKSLFRFDACLLRARFDETLKIKDNRVLAKMVDEGEHELFEKQHADPRRFKNDPEGICYNREHDTPDWLMDSWHPWEKVQTLDFFDKREKLKEDFNDYYEKSLAKKYQEAPTS